MKRFGSMPEHSELESVEVPVGQACARCGEGFVEGDSGVTIPHMEETVEERPWHRECFLRTIFGSVAHQKGKCSCFGGEGEDDPSLSAREAAKASVRHYLMNN